MNQVSDTFEDIATSARIWKLTNSYMSNGRKVQPALGMTWAFCLNTRINLFRTALPMNFHEKETQRVMSIAFSNYLSQSNYCVFEIRTDGVFGTPVSEDSSQSKNVSTLKRTRLSFQEDEFIIETELALIEKEEEQQRFATKIRAAK